jgi:hypothetical protein
VWDGRFAVVTARLTTHGLAPPEQQPWMRARQHPAHLKRRLLPLQELKEAFPVAAGHAVLGCIELLEVKTRRRGGVSRWSCGT